MLPVSYQAKFQGISTDEDECRNVYKKNVRQSTAINYAIGIRLSKDFDSKISLFAYSPASFCCVYSNAFGFYLIYYLIPPLVGKKNIKFYTLPF